MKPNPRPYETLHELLSPSARERLPGDYLEVRLDADEKQAFRDAAELAGIGLSTWVRERLRLVARKELEQAGRTIAFLGR
jgi:uncharacterized protein (DUF1778 family)